LSFIGLGLVNVRRNFGRSVLAVAAMAIASLVVTSLISLAPSVHQAGFVAERVLLGGDVIITGFQVMSSAQDLDAKRVPDASWTWSRPGHDLAGLLAEAVPWTWQYGSMAPTGNPSAAGPAALLDTAVVAALLDSVEAHDRVAAAFPTTILPVLEPLAGGKQTKLGFLLGRDAAADRLAWTGLAGPQLSSGRYLEAQDHGQLVAVTDARRTSRGYPTVSTGGTLELLMPRAVTGPQAADITFDYADCIPVSLQVVGQLDTETSLELTPGGPVPLHWASGAILVPQDTLHELAELAGLAQAPVNAIAVRLTDLIHLDRTVAQLRRAHPELVVFAVRDLVRATRLSGAIEPVMLLNDTGVSGTALAANLVPRTVALNLGMLFAVLAFTIAALIVAANLLVLLSARRKEISILRALGARGGEVAVMVLTEAVLISMVGCVLGFWPVRLLATITLVSNRLSLGRIAILTLGDFGIVCGVALALSLLFGLLPAIASMRMTPTEALRND